jgi:hypothetical protein
MSKSVVLKYNLYMEESGSWRLQVWSHETLGGMDPSIFVWQCLPDVPYQGSGRKIFTNIAHPADMEEYPSGNPDLTIASFFRRDYADVLFESLPLASETLEKIEKDVDDLCEALNKMGL